MIRSHLIRYPRRALCSVGRVRLDPPADLAERSPHSAGVAPSALDRAEPACADECDVSVVVPTRNRAALLARTLDSLIQQRAGSVRYEIPVVDNNSSDGTPAVAEAFTRVWPPVRYLFEPRPGVSHGRNTDACSAS